MIQKLENLRTALKKWKITKDLLTNVFIAISLFFVCCFIDLNPSEDIFRTGKVVALAFSLSAICFIQIKEKMHWSVALFFSYSLGHWAFQNFPLFALFTPSTGFLKISGYREILIPFGCLFFTLFLYRYPRDFIAKVFVYTAVLQSVYGLLQVLDIQLLYGVPEPWFQHTPLAFMGQHTVLGGFLAACLAPALWFSMWLPAGIVFLCALFTGSSTTYASIWVVLSLFVAHRFGKKTALTMQLKLAAFCAGVLIFWHSSELLNPHERIEVWKMGLKAFIENPLFGGGAGYWPGFWQPRFFPSITGHSADNPHGEWVKLLVEYGLVGAGIFLAGLVQFLRKFQLTWPHAVCAAILVYAAANFPFHIVPISILFLWCLGYSMGNHK